MFYINLKVMKQTNGLYPAPLKILEVLREGLDEGAAKGYIAEHTKVSKRYLLCIYQGLQNTVLSTSRHIEVCIAEHNNESQRIHC